MEVRKEEIKRLEVTEGQYNLINRLLSDYYKELSQPTETAKDLTKERREAYKLLEQLQGEKVINRYVLKGKEWIKDEKKVQ
ncbi:hypothetical protein EBS02_09215 [bacterium]|nr:hypothetical protein [bacterium]